MAVKPKTPVPTTRVAPTEPVITTVPEPLKMDSDPASTMSQEDTETTPIPIHTMAPTPVPDDAPPQSSPRSPLGAPTGPQAQVNVNMEKIMNTAEDFVAFGQANVEAFVKSGQIWSNGLQELTNTFDTDLHPTSLHTYNATGAVGIGEPPDRVHQNHFTKCWAAP